MVDLGSLGLICNRDFAMSKPVLVAAGWTPEEAARYELTILRGLAGDKKTLRVYM